MSREQLNRTQIDVLHHSARIQTLTKTPPATTELAQVLNVVSSTISNAKRRLEAEGLVEKKSGKVTELGFDYLKSMYAIVPVVIPMVGTVYAGKKTSNRNHEAIVKLIAKPSSSGNGSAMANYWVTVDIANTFAMPVVSSDVPVFSMVVDGDSMVDEHIVKGDVVLFQPFLEGAGPKQGELIVALFLASKDESDTDLETSILRNLSDGGEAGVDLLAGPTLKYFYSKDDEGYYRLSMRKGFTDNKYTIKTKYCRPIGRVINIIRTTNFQYSAGKLANPRNMAP